MTEADTENLADIENPTKHVKKEDKTIVKTLLAPANTLMPYVDYWHSPKALCHCCAKTYV